MDKPRKSLARKIGITILLLTAPLFVVSLGVFFKHVQAIMHKETMERSYSTLNTTMQRVVNYMSAVKNAAKSNVWLMEANFNPDSLQSLSRRIVTINQSVISCSVGTEPDVFPEYGSRFSVYSVNDGDTILTARESDYDYYERHWYQEPKRTGKDSWLDPFSDFNQGTISLNDAIASYCIPLRPGGGRIQGVVSTDFSFGRLSKIIEASEHPFPSAYYMLLGTDGRYLVYPESSFLFRRTIFSVTDSIQNPDVIKLGREMTAGKQGIMHVKRGDEVYHVCYAPVPETQWSLAMVCLDDEVLSDYNHLVYLAIIVVVVGLMLILLITVSVVRMNIKPIKQLLDDMQMIASGNYDVVIPLSPRKDAVALLQNAFIAMKRTIVAHMKEVKQTSEQVRVENEELEQAMAAAKKSFEEKRRFSQHVLRQIRLPLNILEGMTDTLLSHHLTPSELQVVKDTMAINVIRLDRRVTMLYDSSRPKSEDKVQYLRNSKLPCNELAREVIEYMHTCHANLEFHLETLLSDDVCIQTNHFFLNRALGELLHNAAKFSDGKHITLRLMETESTVCFIVEDTGPGLQKDWHEILTQPFTQANEESMGFGLGLPLAQRHVTGLGGNLIYDADYQQGCRIIIEMPK